MKVNISKPVSVNGVTWQPGEYEVADPFWARQMQTASGEPPAKMGAALDEITQREEQNALRYANMAKLAQLEAELTRREQWAPVNYRQIREAEAVRSNVMSLSALREDIAGLRDDLERGSIDPAWDERTAMYHPDRTEAMPADIAGLDARPLNPSVEATPEQGEYRGAEVVGPGMVQSPHMTRASEEYAKEHAPREGDSHPAQVMEGKAVADAQKAQMDLNAAREKERAGMEQRQNLAKAQAEQRHEPSGEGSPNPSTEAAREEMGKQQPPQGGQPKK